MCSLEHGVQDYSCNQKRITVLTENVFLFLVDYLHESFKITILASVIAELQFGFRNERTNGQTDR